MEIKINKEIRNYKETIFFGLPMRQFVCAVLAVGVAVGLYFGMSRIADRETRQLGVYCGRGPHCRCRFLSLQRTDAGEVSVGVV